MAINPASLTPRRNLSLVQRIAARFYKADPSVGPQPSMRETTQSALPDGSGVSDRNGTVVSFNFDPTRLAIYRDANEMDASSVEVSTALNVIANNATMSEDGSQTCIKVTAAEGAPAQVQQVLDDTVKSMKLHTNLKALVRSLVKYGDLFAEVIANGDLTLLPLKPINPASMWRNEDSNGNLLTGTPKYDENGKCTNGHSECAYEQVDPDSQKILATFEPFQIVHARLNHDEIGLYGRSHVATVRLVWRQLKALLEGLIIGRLSRDLLKLVFYVDTTGLSPADKRKVLREFRESVSNKSTVDMRRENPFSVLTDFYISTGYVRVGGQPMPSQTKVDTIDPKNEGIHDITDIKFFHRELLSGLRVPAAHMNFEEDSQAGLLTQQDVQYVRFLKSIQQDMSTALEPVFRLALLLKGLDPTVDIDITWPDLSAIDQAAEAQTELARAQSDQLYLQEGVISLNYIRKSRFGMSDEEIEAMEKEIEEANAAELEQAQAQLDMQTEAQVKLAAVTAPPATGGPQDRDGQRKGDEGRSRTGRRIPATKSKQGVNNPSGTGSGPRKS